MPPTGPSRAARTVLGLEISTRASATSRAPRLAPAIPPPTMTMSYVSIAALVTVWKAAAV
jgi:hypothetical protein